MTEHKVVRRYPDVGADAAFDDAVATLTNCGQFRLTTLTRANFGSRSPRDRDLHRLRGPRYPDAPELGALLASAAVGQR